MRAFFTSTRQLCGCVAQAVPPSNDRMHLQILNRRLLYASELTDITEQLIVRINNLKP